MPAAGVVPEPPGSSELFPGAGGDAHPRERHPEPFSRPVGGQSSGCRAPKRLCRDAASAAAEIRAAPRLSVCPPSSAVRAEQRQRRACSPGGTGHRTAPRARSPRTAGTEAARLRGTVSSRRSPPDPRPSEKDFHLVFFPLFVFFFPSEIYIYIFLFLFPPPFFFFFYSAVVAGNYLHLKTQRLVPRTSLRGSIEAALPPGG